MALLMATCVCPSDSQRLVLTSLLPNRTWINLPQEAANIQDRLSVLYAIVSLFLCLSSIFTACEQLLLGRLPRLQ